jgi:hypothetical protein
MPRAPDRSVVPVVEVRLPRTEEVGAVSTVGVAPEVAAELWNGGEC